jgi:hypothetical protein
LTGLLAWPISWLEMAVAVPSRLACRGAWMVASGSARSPLG